MKVLSLNVGQLKFPLGKGQRNVRALMLGDILSKEKYDVICFQELFRKKAQDILIRWLDEIYPYYVVDRSRGKYLVGANSGLAIFSRHPITREIRHRFTTYRGVENFAKKSVWGVELDVEGTPVCVFTTHLQTGIGSEPCICKLLDKNNLSSDALKTLQLKEIVRVVKEFAGENDNVVVTGDFNIRAGSKLHGVMYEKFSSIELLDTFSPEDSELQSTVIGKEDKRIDYIWFDGTGDSIITGDYHTSPEITDHNGVSGYLDLTHILKVI